jgi:DNA-binding Lrp family transcriptional regulator
MKSLLARLLARRGSRSAADTVVRFRDVQARESAYDYHDRGLQTVALRQVTGSVNRYLDFDSHFRLKADRPRERLEAARRAMRRGEPWRPVDLYQIKEQYFVVDGNHRIAAAKERGLREIEARVVEFLPAAGTPENVLYRERVEFQEATGLPAAITLTEPGQYRYLLSQIEAHCGWLAAQRRVPVSLPEAATDWQETVYRPLAALIEKAGLSASFPGRTVSDLYAFVSHCQWDKRSGRSFGFGIEGVLTTTMEGFRLAMLNKKEDDYPEMLREITVFVLMNITTKREPQILERLFALPQVREVHSVHGAIDIIAKIILVRDLLSSDAEVISQFVQSKIRHLPGVISTQTLIPGFSRIKEG